LHPLVASIPVDSKGCQATDQQQQHLPGL
jgi:hypothetical protein